MHLDEMAVRAGVRLDQRDSVGSTNDEGLKLARDGERGPLWVTARRQTMGRGRRGRAWTSEPGNLYASLLLTDPSPAEYAAQLSFVAALALHDAIAATAPSIAPRLALKWPNDMLVDGAKVGGILVEGESGGAGLLTVVIGVGVNCSTHPPETSYPATNLARAGAPVASHDLFSTLSRTMLERLAQWNHGKGFERTRSDWLARATGIGAATRVVLPERELVGTFETLDPAGRLILRLADASTTAIAAGDVFPLGLRSPVHEVG
jgi:BirA family biotin operon repressor/biotin-[acetyl-CoA-carboxylase] ligase